ncbi:unnamed protein product [Mytilus coruscus]|uniref:CARD domain-containing protein n=1 Tax=Mytilus coruscus TaxID=42192 RepID=A0A6J8C1B4_MYTCO|nr:unnamed protein product [Mytilus coruscus]
MQECVNIKRLLYVTRMASRKNQKEREYYLKIVYILFQSVPRVLEEHIKRKHNIELLVAIEKTEEDLKKVLTIEEWNHIFHIKSICKHQLYPYYDGILLNTTLDTSVMDFLITEGVLTMEDSDKVGKCAGQTEKNKFILDRMMDQSENACDLFLKALQRDHENFAEICMKINTQEVDLVQREENQKIGHNLIRIRKNYDMLVRELSNTSGIIDHLIEVEVFNTDDMQEIMSIDVQSEMNRKLISKIRTAKGYSEFLVALHDDEVSSAVADIIELTPVKEADIARYKPTPKYQSIGTSLGLSTMISLCATIDKVTIPKAEPIKEDKRIQADLKRLTVHMQFIIEEEEINEATYNHLASELNKIIQRLGGEDVTQSCDEYFKSLSCGHEMNCILKKIKKQKRQESIEREIIREIEIEMKIPKNVRERHNALITQWERNDEVFSVTYATGKIMQIIQENSHTTIVGSPGSGKTSISRHVALELKQKEDYHIIPVDSVKEILAYGNVNSRQVFVHDDILGVYGVDVNKENKLDSRCKAIVNLLETSGSKLVMTCRKAVFNSVKLTASLVSKNAFDIDREENKLTREDKKRILKAHCSKHNVNPDMYDSLFLESAFIMFPLLCELFANQKKYQQIGSRFFTHPYECLIDQLKKLQERSTRQKGQTEGYYYAALVMCMINGGKLSTDNFPDPVIKGDVYEQCELDQGTSKYTILRALEELEGTYTVKSGKQLSFIHDTIFEVIAYHHGTKYPNQILKYLSTSYIANMVTVVETHNALCILLQEHDYHLLAERIYKDIQSIELNHVFRNPALKHIAFFKVFKQMLQNKPYNEIKNLFFHNQDETNCRHIVDQGENLLIESNIKDEFLTTSLTRSQDTLMNKIIQKDNSVVYRIKVISWVVFYGHELLLRYLLHLASTQNDSPCKIFGDTRSEQTRLLTLGCCSGDLDTLKIVLENVEHECLNATLLQTKEDFETKDKNRHRCKTPLTAACLHVGVAPPCISKLIKMGSNLHKMDESGHVPVFNAAFSRNRDVLKALLDANADINYGNNGDSSPLFTATSLNHLDAVKILIEFGASVNKGKSDNTTPLFRATERGNLEIARFLVEKGADVNLCDNLKRSPLHGASTQRFRNIDFKRHTRTTLPSCETTLEQWR